MYDQAYQRHSPGKLLLAEMVSHAIDREGVGAINFVLGDEPYKSKWTPQYLERHELTVFNTTARGHLLALLLNRLLPTMERTPYLAAAKRRASALLQRGAGA